MLTLDHIFSYFERTIAEQRLSGNTTALRETQLALGVLMRAAESAQDRASAQRFRVLAANAANRRDEIEAED